MRPDRAYRPDLWRAIRMVQRNLLLYKHIWMVLASGFFEPVFYLVAIGLGVGSMIPSVEGMSYPAFVAPALLASSCMNGAISDGFFNIFFRLHVQKTYEGVLATPMRVPDVAFGELLWALSRGALYACAFLVVIVVLGGVLGTPIVLSPLGVLALPGAVLAAASFSALALCATSFLRTWHDFDMVMGLAVMPMFLFSGTFFPIDRVPLGARAVIEVMPLYHGAAMLRQLTTGRVDWTLGLHVAYLVLVGVGGFVVAMRRLERALVK